MGRTIKIKRIKKNKKKIKVKKKLPVIESKPKLPVIESKPKLPAIKPKPKLRPIKKIGYWCDYFPGRLPFPIECTYNRQSPLECIFINKVKKIVKNTPKCPSCQRYVTWEDWKKGKWNKTIQEIKKGADLRNQPVPFKKDYEVD
jgi:hypothetical protein